MKNYRKELDNLILLVSTLPYLDKNSCINLMKRIMAKLHKLQKKMLEKES